MAIIAGNQAEVIDLTDGYSVFLSQESHVWEGDTEGVSKTQTTTVKITAYQGKDKATCTIDTAISAPTGITVVNDGKTPSPTLTITATTACKTSGVITIPITINQGDIVIEKQFTYSIATKGEDGQAGAAGTSVTAVESYYLASAKGTGVLRTDKGWELNREVKPTKGLPYLWMYQKVSYSDGTSSYSEPVLVGTFAQDGNGIQSMVYYYLASPNKTGVTTSTSGWSTTAPELTPTNKYMWSYIKTTYTDGTVKDSTTVVTGAYGDMPETPYSLYIKSSNGQYFNVPNQTTTLSLQIVQGDNMFEGADVTRVGTIEWWNLDTSTKVSSAATYTTPAITGTHSFEARLIIGSVQKASARFSCAYIKEGTDGKTPVTHIKYCAVGDPERYEQLTDEPDKWMGTYVDYNQEDPTDVSLYKWSKIGSDNNVYVKEATTYYLATDQSSGVTCRHMNDNLFYARRWITEENLTTYWKTQKTTMCIDYENGVPNYRVDYQTADDSNAAGLRTDYGSMKNGQRYRYSFSIKSSVHVESRQYQHFWVDDPQVTNGSYHHHSEPETPFYELQPHKWEHVEVFFNVLKEGCRFYVILMNMPKDSYLWVKDFSLQEWSDDTGGWTTTMQNTTELKPYLWCYTVSHMSDGEEVVTPPYIMAVHGQKGMEGKSSYFHRKYAPSANPTSDQMTETPQAYMGTYVDETEADSTDPSKYQWTKVQGDDGRSITGTTQYYGLSAKPNVQPTTWSTIPQTPDIANPYHWSYLKILYSDNSSEETARHIIGTFGRNGTDGTSITGYKAHYAAHNSNTTPPTKWLDNPPNVNDTNRYLWMYETISFDNGNTTDTEKRVIGTFAKDGKDGTPGTNGTNGQTSYFHVKYSPVSNPTSSQMTETPDVYIGTYADFTQADSNDPTKYTWTQFKGDPGKDGINGTNGIDGTTHYLHMAYANSADGKKDFSTTVAAGRSYLGTYHDETQEDSTDTTKYKWTKIRGEDGKGIEKIDTYYRLSSLSDGNTTDMDGWETEILQTTPSLPYLYSYEKTTYNDGTVTKTTPRIISTYVKDGDNGRGIKTITDYYLATGQLTGINADTPGWTTTPQNTNSINKYLWNHELIEYDDGTHEYTNSRIIGTHSEDGKDGEDGVSFTGITQYYLVSANKTGVTTSTSGWTTTMQTMTPTLKYLWCYTVTHFSDKGTEISSPVIIGVYGETGTPGKDGTNGKTPYFHIKYAPVANPSASQMSETPDVYIGTYVDFTQSDSTDPKSYTWAKFQGDPGNDGINGTNGIDGKTYYLHIAYANSADGKTGFSTTDSANKEYVGVCHDLTQADPTDATKYKWSLIKGSDGKGISKIESFYLTTNSSSGITTSTSGWSTTFSNPSATSKYLWAYEKTTFNDSTTSQTVPRILSTYVKDGQNGAAGRGIASITDYYLASASNSGVTTSTSGWTTNLQAIDGTKKYLWNYEKITYTDNTSTSTTPFIVSTYVTDGVSVTGVTEHYGVNNSTTTAPTSWQATPPNTTETNRYLWNYETFSYSNGTTTDTKKRIIGTFAKDGANGTNGTNGADGNSITSVTNYYLVSNKNTGITTTTSGWVTTPPQMTSTNKYLWNYEVIKYSKTADQISTPCVIGVYGDEGKPGANGTNGVSISSVTTYYKTTTTNSAPAATSTGWSTAYPAMDATNKYLWSYTKTTLSNNTSSNSSPVLIGTFSVDGQSVSSVVTEYYVSTSKTTQTGGSWGTTSPQWQTGKYLWIRQKVTYSNPTKTEYTTPYVDSAWEKVTEINNKVDSLAKEKTERYYYSSTSDTELAGGSWSTTKPAESEDRYLWIKDKFTFLDGSSTETSPMRVTGSKGVDPLNLHITPTINDDHTYSLRAKLFKGVTPITDADSANYGTMKWYVNDELTNEGVHCDNLLISVRSTIECRLYKGTNILTSTSMILEPTCDLEGDNLVLNGYINYNKTNFSNSDIILDTNEKYRGSGGSIKFAGNKSWLTDEFIPVNPEHYYSLSLDLKCPSSKAGGNIRFVCYDIDHNEIIPAHVAYLNEALPMLTQDLKNGDTVVHLSTLEGWDTTTSNSIQRGFIFWDYKDSTGYTYPPQTYSRHYMSDAYENTNINTSAKTITLKSSYSGETVKAGTYVSQCNAATSLGNNIVFSGMDMTPEWNETPFKYRSIHGYEETGGVLKKDCFPYGTAFIKLGYYYFMGSLSASDTIWMTNLEFKDISAAIEMETYISETENEIKIYVGEKYTSLEETEQRFTSVEQNINNWSVNIQNMQDQLKYMRFDEDGLWIGDSSLNMELLLQSGRIAFVVNKDKDNPPMWITDDMIHINKLEIVNQFQIGDLIWTAFSDGTGILK